MARMIDADELVKVIENLLYEPDSVQYIWSSDVLSAIRSAPTLDAIPVEKAARKLKRAMHSDTWEAWAEWLRGDKIDEREANEPMTDYQTIRALLPRAEILAQLAEECAELAQAALKLRRALTGENPTPVSAEDAEDHLWEEIADVILCVNLLVEWPVNNDAASAIDKLMDKKEARWARRLRAARNRKEQADVAEALEITPKEGV